MRLKQRKREMDLRIKVISFIDTKTITTTRYVNIKERVSKRGGK